MVSASLCLQAASARNTGRWAFNGKSEKWRQSQRWTRGMIVLLRVLCRIGSAPRHQGSCSHARVIVHIINGFIELAQPLAVATSCDRNSFKLSPHLWGISPLLQIQCKGRIQSLVQESLLYSLTYGKIFLLQLENSADSAVGSVGGITDSGLLSVVGC